MNFMISTSDSAQKSFTYYLLSFALGGLLGDVFFHTIPHLNSGGHGHDDHGHGHHDHGHHDHGHAHSEEDMQTNLIIILGIWVFFLIEKITHTYFESNDDHGHSHSHSSKVKSEKKDDAKKA